MAVLCVVNTGPMLIAVSITEMVILYKYVQPTNQPTKQSSSVNYKFKVGDKVKISKHKRVFEKSYLPNWSEETFTVAQRIARDPPVYKLKEHDGEPFTRTFLREPFTRPSCKK